MRVKTGLGLGGVFSIPTKVKPHSDFRNSLSLKDFIFSLNQEIIGVVDIFLESSVTKSRICRIM